MGNLKNNTKKLCSFYVSDWHLVTMLLPYINKELQEKANIITILENDIEENIKTILSKLRLKNEDEILKIDWKKTNGKRYSDIKDKLKNISENKNNIILINGSKECIDAVRSNVENVLKELLQSKKINIKIIDCYEVTEFNKNIEQILSNHNKILNTSGEREIEEIFEGYTKFSDKKIAL